MTADLTIRLLAPDLEWDSYPNLSARSFGPADETRVRANIEPIVADGRCLGAFSRHALYARVLLSRSGITLTDTPVAVRDRDAPGR